MKYIFIDTNLLLHFQRPDQIDWRKVSNLSDVTIVIAPIIIRELEKHKFQNPSPKLRDRATDLTKWFHELLDNNITEIRDGIGIQFLEADSGIDFLAYRLSSVVSDDHLIASIIEHPANSGDKLLAANDFGLKVKARSRGIGYVKISEDLALPVEPDPLEKKYRQVRLENEKLKSRQPMLRISFDNNKASLAIQRRSFEPIDTATELNSIKQKFSKKHIPESGNQIQSPLKMSNLTLPSVDTRAINIRYNQELDRYYSEYLNYFAARNAQIELESRTYELNCVLKNSGTAPATDIDVVLTFPKVLLVFGENDFASAPTPPPDPQEPNYLLGSLNRSRALASFAPRIAGFPRISSDGDAVFENEVVSFSLSSLKHGYSWSLEKFFFSFPIGTSIKSFQVSVSVSAAELPKEVVHKISVKVID